MPDSPASPTPAPIPPVVPVPAPRPVAAAAITDQVYRIFPNDLNHHETVFGGMILAQMDRFSVVVAERHAGAPCVTVGVDAVHFENPAGRSDTLYFSLAINRAWTSSMEIGCRVEAQALGEVGRRHILSAYLTFIALGPDRRPVPVPPVAPGSATEQRRFEAAGIRRAGRLAQAETMKRLRAAQQGPDEGRVALLAAALPPAPTPAPTTVSDPAGPTGG